MNNNPSVIVIIKLIKLWFLFFCIKLWWLQVTLTPEDKRIIVFNKGIENGFRVIIPKGGQLIPTSIAGERLEWKKAQKKEKKNNISETINNIKPNFKPVKTFLVWAPSRLDSVNMSINHKIINRTIKAKLNSKG